MKSWVWLLAVAIIIAFVFGLSFVAQFNPETGKGQASAVNTKTASESKILEPRFVTRQVPDGESDPLPQEQYNPGYQDYWFINPHPTAVRFGLEGKKCTCTGVQVFLVPPDHAWWRAEGAAFVKDGQIQVEVLQKEFRSPAVIALMKKLEGVELLSRVETTLPPAIDVQPGQVGFVRMGWKNEKIQRDVMSATLWLGQPELRDNIRLEAAIHTHAVLYVLDDVIDVGTLNSTDRTKAEAKITIVCSTREKLPLKAAFINPVERESIVIGSVKEVSGEALGNLRRDVKVPVKAAYTIPLTAKWQGSGDGYPEIGPFIRRIEVGTSDETVDAKAQKSGPIRIVGKIEGDIEVVGTSERGNVLLNRFERQEGARAEVALESRNPGMRLKIDRQRTASFIDAELDKSPRPSGDKFRWRLQVRVGPGKVSGEFPRGLDPNPIYRDSAVYVIIEGDTPRTVRIPVEGRADN